MASITKLERLLRPYWIGGGFSGTYTQYDEYRNKGITVRVDEEDFFMQKLNTGYKRALEKAAKDLGLVE